MPTAEPNSEPLVPRTGWGALHLFCRLGGSFDADAVRGAAAAAREQGLQVVAVALLGHKADLGFVALGPDLWSLQAFERAVREAGLVPVASYVSLTEVSEYAANVPEAMKEARLHPELPPEGMRAFCFYPMSKRRGERDNWYSLPYERREELMRGHGAVGRTFRGRVVQLITGSTGLDDWEWGVTLFGVHPDDLKDCVYEMRFDEVSARYAEFGPFYTGLVAPLDEVLARVGPT
jgi:chlorite dismutase